ncbi:hypothetical protein B0H10DRAFT_2208173 [Mycena sp. CBHHK59/15]|nr:hypothetical protein B0H10DRAFT_2208173 [Mycena sp. CBHHK59/15]
MTDTPLPTFMPLPEDNSYAALHNLLWAKEPTSSQPLCKCIEACAADDLSLWTDTHTPDQRDCHPLYLQPPSPKFAAVDTILVMEGVLCLVQSSLAESHSCVDKTLLWILARLKTNKIPVDSLDLVYCPIGTGEGHINKLVRHASPQARELGNLSQIALTRLSSKEVLAEYNLDYLKGKGEKEEADVGLDDKDLDDEADCESSESLESDDSDADSNLDV